jgi:rubrerythrin
MNCVHCKVDLPNGSKICPECGSPSGQIAVCGYCGESSPAPSRFCQACGKPLNAAIASTVAPNGSFALGGEQAIFAFLLSEEKLRSVRDKPIRIPYGCSAVVIVDGVVTSIQTQIPAKLEAPSAIGEFFSQLVDGARALMGQRQREVKTWIVSDFRQLPLISYSYPLPLSDAPDARLRFEFWLDAHDHASAPDLAGIGLFFQRVVGNRPHLSNEEFRQAAINGVRVAMAEIEETGLQDPEKRDGVLAVLKSSTGISGKCLFLKGKNMFRRDFEVSTIRQPVACKGCGHEYGREYMNKLKFCEECGTSLAGLDWVGGNAHLQTSDGKALVMRLSVLADASAPFDEAALARAVINVLRPVVGKKDMPTLLEGAVLSDLTEHLNHGLARTFRGTLSDFVVHDIKLADQDWFFKTDALVDEEMRKIEANQRLLAVGTRDLDYRDAAFAVRLRSLAQESAEAVAERRAGLEAARGHAALAVEERKVEVQTDLDISRLEVEAAERRAEIDHASEQRQFERKSENFLRERNLARDLRREDRGDESEQAAHEMNLEKEVARHDIELGDLTGEAQSRERRREITDQVFSAEEDLRLRATERKQLGGIEEDLADRQGRRQEDLAERDHQRGLNKLRAMAEIEANMTRQEFEFETAKMQNLRGLDAAQILAMQAAQLVKEGGEQAAAGIVQSIAQSQIDAKEQARRDDLYKQMLEIKDEAAISAIGAHNLAMEAVLKTNAEMARVATAASNNSNEGYKEAARIAQTTNEKSMDAMQKVASAVAGRKTSDAKEVQSDSKLIKCATCGHGYEGRKKFCPQCGAPQGAVDT